MADAPTVFPVAANLRKHARVLLLGTLAVVGAVGSLLLAIWVLPSLLTRNVSASATAVARVTAENNIRTSLIAALAVLGAAVITAGYSARTTRLTTESQRIDRQGQITDRYTRAIDQLGSDRLDVRLGGIYALERIARDSARDQPVVMEILTAYVRTRTQQLEPLEPDAHIPEDVQAALTVIGRRNDRFDIGSIDLSRTNLAGANLRNASLARSILTEVDWTNTDLAYADLAGANLAGATLAYVNLAGANLAGANLAGANLANADLTDANLTDANLTGARLPGPP